MQPERQARLDYSKGQIINASFFQQNQKQISNSPTKNIQGEYEQFKPSSYQVSQTQYQQNQLQVIKLLIENQSKFLQQFAWLINIPVVNCLLDDVQIVKIKSRIQSLKSQKMQQIAPQLSLQKNGPKGACFNKGQVQKQVKSKGISDKKIYQLSVFTKQIHSQISQQNQKGEGVKCIVDVGCGQGFLCKNLARLKWEKQIKIVGIDSNHILIQKAIQTQNKAKQKNLIEATSIQYLNCIFDSKYTLQTTKSDYTYGLISLHGCGSLFQQIAQNFMKNRNCKYFASISCCYNLLRQNYKPLSPLGEKLFPKSIDIRSFLMLACQSVDTWHLDKEKAQNSFRNNTLRAVLQRLLWDHKIKIPERMGKINTKKILNFNQYFNAVVKTGSIPDLTQKQIELNQYQQMFENSIDFMRLLWTLRGWVGYVAENFITTDRILYLKEQEKNQNCIFQMKFLFDRNISVRNVCISGKKLKPVQNLNQSS